MLVMRGPVSSGQSLWTGSLIAALSSLMDIEVRSVGAGEGGRKRKSDLDLSR